MSESESGGYWSRKLEQLGVELPTVVPPVANYVPAVRAGTFVYTSGQLPMVDGTLAATGKVGAEVDPEQAADLARTCALNALAAVDAWAARNGRAPAEPTAAVGLGMPGVGVPAPLPPAPSCG